MCAFTRLSGNSESKTKYGKYEICKIRTRKSISLSKNTSPHPPPYPLSLPPLPAHPPPDEIKERGKGGCHDLPGSLMTPVSCPSLPPSAGGGRPGPESDGGPVPPVPPLPQQQLSPRPQHQQGQLRRPGKCVRGFTCGCPAVCDALHVWGAYHLVGNLTHVMTPF